MLKPFALLLCALLLVGCTTPQGASEPPAELPAQTLHSPGHTLETQTRGMLQVFPTGIRGDCGAFAMGRDLLLWDGVNILLLAGKQLEIRATAPAQSVLLSGSSGVCLYSPDEENIRILDTDLSQIADISLPEQTVGLPAVSNGMDSVFFCTDTSLCQLDSGGIVRVLRNQPDIQDAYIRCLSDTLLFVSLTDSRGKTQHLFLNPENGSTVWSQLPADTAAFHDGTLFWANTDPRTREICLTEPDGSTLQLNPGKGEEFLTFLPELSAVITILPATEKQPLTARLYDLSSGILRSSVELSGIDLLTGACATEDGTLYLTALSGDSGESWLLRWNYNAFPAEADDTFLSSRYTADSPDRQGMQKSQNTAQTLGRKYGIGISIFEAAADIQPWDYRFTPEFRVPETNWALNTVDTVLAQFPEGFLKTLTRNHDSLTICLVGTIQGTAESGSLEAAQGLQFLEENRCIIALTTTGSIEYNLFHEFSHLIDTQVINNSRAYDNWETLNPAGFSYSFDISKDMSQFNNLITGQSRAFIDEYAMYSPAEDRARILECAANSGNEAFFTSPILQEKLLRVCTGIREAFGLRDAPEAFVWEQYLHRPIAPSA